MSGTVRTRIKRLLANNKEHGRYLRLICVAALAVTLVVVVSLMQNGVAMTHTEVVLDCRVSGEVAHTHSADCYDDEGRLVCTLPERELHAHTDGCYEETRQLICGLEESEGHQHTDACYDDEGNLVCGLDESEGHTHTDACYEVTRELVCGLPELTEEHVHGPGCFVTVQVEDGDGPADGTGDGEPPMVSDEPASGDGANDDPEADSETPAYDDPVDDLTAAEMPAQAFEHTFTQADERGVEQPVLTVHVDAPAGALPKGSSMQAQWVDPAELSAKAQKAVEDAVAQKAEGRITGQQAVDISFFDAEGNKVEPARMVMVTFTSALLDTKDKTVVVHVDDLSDEETEQVERDLAEGKTLDEVEPDRTAQPVEELSDETLAKRELELADGELAVESNQFSTYVLNVTTLRHTMRANGETVTITVDAPATAGVPADASLSVTEIGDAGGYYDYLGQVSEVVPEGNIQLARFFDITIVDGQGNEVQPAEPVQVRIELADAPPEEDAAATVVHFPDDGGMDLVAATEDEGTTTFDAEGFSVYGVVYTVDFHYEVDGKTYDLSIPGGGFASLRGLVEALGVAEGAGLTPDEFVARVSDVSFSDPGLVWVGRVEADTTVGGLKQANALQCEPSADLGPEEIAAVDATVVASGDWALVSLRPFDTEEILAVTMANGETFAIRVTDAQISTHVITADGYDYEITVTYGPEAGIPDGAKLSAEEVLPGTDAYDYYLARALDEMGLGEEPDGDDVLVHTIEAARFFDISILVDGKEVEPLAPVSVNITYIGQSLEENQNVTVVHFAETGIEVIDAIAGDDGSGTQVSFEQGSFSVTGTIVDATAVTSGEYYIVHHEGDYWYALASEGSYVDVTANYDAASASVVDYSGDKNITWQVTKSGNEYSIKAKGENTYITLNGSVTGTSNTALNIHPGSSESSKNAIITRDSSYQGYWGYNYGTHTYHNRALGWNNGFAYTTGNVSIQWMTTNIFTGAGYYYYAYGQEARATNVQFAKVSSNSGQLDGNYPNKTYNIDQLDSWLDQAMNDEPIQEVSKTASVYDYDNRIYQIEIKARSGVLGMASDISLGLVTDVSNSMLFPSKLTPYYKNNVSTVNINLNQSTMDSITTSDSNLKTGQNVFFTVADVNGTSTVCALYQQGGTWYAMDASYYSRWQAGIKKVGDNNNYDYVANRQITLRNSGADRPKTRVVH